MNIRPPPRLAAFTMIEVLVIISVVALGVFMLLPTIGNERRPASDVICVDNLKHTGLAFQIWAGDHGGKYPMDVPVAQGGAQEFTTAGNVAACFQVMSNELAAPQILYCPADSSRRAATNWTVNFTRTNVSYFIGLNATNPLEPTALAGDANLAHNGRPVASGWLEIGTNTFTWIHGRHADRGHMLIPDLSIQSATHMGFVSWPGTYLITNTLVIP